MTGAPQFEDILELLLRLLQANGISAARLDAAYRRIQHKLAKHPIRSPAIRHVRDMPMVLSRWYSEPKYLDADGHPKPLPLRGKDSVEAIIRHTLGTRALADSVQQLLRNGVIRREGQRYRPIDERVVYHDQDARLHGLEAVRGLLRTLDRNLLDTEATFKVFECVSSNPAVPVSAFAALSERLRAPATEFLRGADVELNRLHQTRRKRERTTRIGVGVYVFDNTPQTQKIARSLKARA